MSSLCVCVISCLCKGECLMELLGLSQWPCRCSTSDTRWHLRFNQSEHVSIFKIPSSFLDLFPILCCDFSSSFTSNTIQTFYFPPCGKWKFSKISFNSWQVFCFFLHHSHIDLILQQKYIITETEKRFITGNSNLDNLDHEDRDTEVALPKLNDAKK